MKELLDLVAPWGIGMVLTTAALFGFFPKFVMHLMVLIYPRDHDRRRELPAELEVVPYRERLLWVFGQCTTVLFEGVPARARDIRSRQQERSRLNEFAGSTDVQLMSMRAGELSPDRRRRVMELLEVIYREEKAEQDNRPAGAEG